MLLIRVLCGIGIVAHGNVHVSGPLALVAGVPAVVVGILWCLVNLPDHGKRRMEAATPVTGDVGARGRDIEAGPS